MKERAIVNKKQAEKMIETIEARQQQQIGATVSVLAPAFITAVSQMADQVAEAMAIKGFWQSDNTGEKIALMHSELSEALEADRKDIEADDKVPEFSGLEAELADTVIRILDFAGHHELRLGEAIIAKTLYNLTRPPKHGKAY